MLAKEVFINATEGHQFGDSGYQPTDLEPGEIYRNCRREYGRCVSKVYVDNGSDAIPHGWVFQSKDRYTDSADTYLREVWVILANDDGTVFDLRRKRPLVSL